MLISITLTNYSPTELAKEIVGYITKKKIKKINIVILEELKKPVKKIFSSNNFDKLQSEIKRSLEDEGIDFYLNIPEIKTSFEEFSYGIEANSCEKDFQSTFSKYK